MSNKLNCFFCDWSGSKYELLIGQNGIKCPKCKKHIPQDAEGCISVENGLPETGGFYPVKTKSFDGYFECAFSFTMAGKGVWVVPDATDITHWKYK